MDRWSLEEKPRGFLAEPSKYANQECLTLPDLIEGNSGLWVLCGAPGSGKSEAIRLWVDSLVDGEPETEVIAWTSRSFGRFPNFELIRQNVKFREACEDGKKLVVVIDGFDQFRDEEGLPFEALAATLSSVPHTAINRIRLVIGCRSRDWDANRAAALKALWDSKSDTNRIVEICPLTRAQVVLAVESREISPDVFLGELFEMRMEASAHWPFSLRSLMDSFEASGKIAENVKENITRSIDLMLKDHKTSPHQIDPHKTELLKQCARRLAAVMVFSGNQILSRSTLHETGEVRYEDVLGPAELAAEHLNSVLVPISGGHLSLLCDTSLLTVVRPPTDEVPQPHMGFTHQSYAEFLAAEYIVNLDIFQLRSLLTVPTTVGERIPAHFLEVASWLASMNIDWFDYLMAACPEILLRSDGAQFEANQKARLLQVLFDQTARWDASVFSEVRLLTPSFRFSGLADLLCPVISDDAAHPFSRRLAVQIAGLCKVIEAEKSLWSILERSTDSGIRNFTIHALHSVLQGAELSSDSIVQLRKAAGRLLGVDDDDELKGLALNLLVPAHLPARDAIPYITIPRNPNFHGSYRRFLDRTLSECISKDDLEAFLRLGAVTPSIFHVELIAENTAASVLRLFSTIESPSEIMMSGFVGWVMRCAKRHAVMPLVEDRGPEGEDVALVEEGKRLEWLESVMNRECPDQVATWSIMRALVIYRPPLDWSLRRLIKASPSQREGWSTLVQGAVRNFEERVACLPLLLDAYETIQELRASLLPCEEGMNIHESYLAYAERQGKKEIESEREIKKQKMPLTRREWHDRVSKIWLRGDDLAWIDMWRGCGLSDDGTSCDMSGGELIADWKGWKSLSREERDEVIGCARAFLINRDDNYRGADHWERTRGSEAAYYAVGLTVDGIENDPALRDAIYVKWITAWFGHCLNSSIGNKSVVKRLYQLNPEACIVELKRSFSERENEDRVSKTAALFLKCWDERLSSIYGDYLLDAEIGSRELCCGLELLSRADMVAAIQIISSWMDRIEGENCLDFDKQKDIVLFCATFFTAAHLFDRVIPHISDPLAARRIMCAGNGLYGYGSDGLTVTLSAMKVGQVAAIASIAANAFPEEDSFFHENADEIYTDSIDGEGLEQNARLRSREVTAAMQEHRISSLLLAYYAKFVDASEAIRFRDLLPESRRDEWSFAWSQNVRHSAQSGWLGIQPPHLFKLVQLRHSCFIRKPDDLLDFVMMRLRAFASQPWALEHKPLWNEPYGHEPTAKEEEELSRRLKIWLDRELKLIVNCEVQPIELIGKRLDLKIEFAGEQNLCVIVEVKKAENVGVETSMQTQLVDVYLRQGKQTQGIYLVAWFGDKPSVLKGDTFEEKSVNLENLRLALKKSDSIRVDCLLMDLRHPNPEMKIKKRRRSRI